MRHVFLLEPNSELRCEKNITGLLKKFRKEPLKNLPHFVTLCCGILTIETSDCFFRSFCFTGKNGAFSTTEQNGVNFLRVLLNNSPSNPATDSSAFKVSPQRRKASIFVASEQVLDTSDRASIQHAATKVTNMDAFLLWGASPLPATNQLLLHLNHLPFQPVNNLLFQSRNIRLGNSQKVCDLLLGLFLAAVPSDSKTQANNKFFSF